MIGKPVLRYIKERIHLLDILVWGGLVSFGVLCMFAKEDPEAKNRREAEDVHRRRLTAELHKLGQEAREDYHSQMDQSMSRLGNPPFLTEDEREWHEKAERLRERRREERNRRIGEIERELYGRESATTYLSRTRAEERDRREQTERPQERRREEPFSEAAETHPPGSSQLDDLIPTYLQN